MTQFTEMTGMDELRQSMASLLHPDFDCLRAEIAQLQEQLSRLQALSHPLPEQVHQLQLDLQALSQQTRRLEGNLAALQEELDDPEKVTRLLKLGLHPALAQSIDASPDPYSDAIAPVIIPAIRSQIRNSRADMIEALSPIIGRTISTAIAEAFQDFRRRIDSQLKQNLNVRQQLRRTLARLRGVSDADLMMREALPYTIRHAFLIQRETGILLAQVSQAADRQDMDIVSAMLTAIRDFARDTFGEEESELENIQYGNWHILLKAGKYAYLAVVVEGQYPPGYSGLLERTVHEINIQYEDPLRKFQGDMQTLPDFSSAMRPVLAPDGEEWEVNPAETTLNPGQRMALWLSVGGAVLLLSLLIFGCIFFSRLMPLAFPAPTQTPTPVLLTFTPSPTSTSTPLDTPTLTPTATRTPTPIPTRAVYEGVMSGNVWAHQAPDPYSPRNPVAVTVNTVVELQAVYKNWVKVSWKTEFASHEGWVPLEYVGITYPLPRQLVTPAQ